MDVYADLGRNIREVRRRVDLTQAELASRVGLSRTSVAQIEAGTQRVALHRVYQIARALGTQLADILPPYGEDTGFDEVSRERLAPEARARLLSILRSARNAEDHQPS